MTIRRTLMKDPKTLLLGVLITASAVVAAPGPQPARADSASTGTWFDFGSAPAEPGHTRVRPADRYSAERGYGLQETGGLTATAAGITSDGPFFFSVAVPEGNYRVTVALAGDEAGSTPTVKAEARRLMIERLSIAPGEIVTRTFCVNVRTPRLPDGGQVELRSSTDRSSATWDQKLTLEFNGECPAVDWIRIAPAPDAVTVFIAGDSTVTDSDREPWTGWGQMLPRFFGPGVAVANHAESGRSLRSFRAERRLDKVLSQIRPGDYLFIQFGHNDMKERGEGIGPFTSFAADLRSYIAAAREHGATPVLVTPMERRWFDGDQIKNTFGDYPDAVRQVAEEQGVALIDLNAMSETLFETLGREGSKRAFVHYPAGTFPGQDEALHDNSHFSPYGAYQLAHAIVKGIRANGLDLVDHLRQDIEPFDPSAPPPPGQWSLPTSPSYSALAPEGS